jgi:acyl carrier protein
MPPPATRTEIEADLQSYLSLRFPHLGACDANTPLLDGGIDSLGILELMTFLADRFGFELQDSDFEPENFETTARIVNFIEQKQSQ